jgi:hypothetical protein
MYESWKYKRVLVLTSFSKLITNTTTTTSTITKLLFHYPSANMKTFSLIALFFAGR